MVVKEVDDNIKAYFNKVKENYPGLDLHDFEKICKAPFIFFREAIESGTFPTILIKYLGKLVPFTPKRNRKNDINTPEEPDDGESEME